MKARLIKTLIILLLTQFTACSQNQNEWQWQSAKPEEQGMSSDSLAGVLRLIKERHYNFHSLLILRNNKMVLETYVHPYYEDVKEDIKSCTKTVMGILTGIAIKDGKIITVRERVLDFFPKIKKSVKDTLKQDLNVEHLLTMTAGVDWSKMHTEGFETKDFVAFTFQQPSTSPPGTNFYYEEGSSHMLSLIIQQVTGEKASDYADEKLFKPLGISDFDWLTTATGATIGHGFLYLKPKDMMKIGYLLLHNGKWNELQILPEDWVKHATIGSMAEHDYGYQIWVNGDGSYEARGNGGKRIMVLPKYDMIIVTTGSIDRAREQTILDSIKYSIVSSISGKDTLPENPVAFNKLEALNKELNDPKPVLVELPPIVKTISGKTYSLDDQSTVQFNFANQGELEINADGKQKLMAGLDGKYRINKNPGSPPIAMKGLWNDDKTLVIEFLNLEKNSPFFFTVKFSNEKIKVTKTSKNGEELSVQTGKMVK